MEILLKFGKEHLNARKAYNCNFQAHYVSIVLCTPLLKSSLRNFCMYVIKIAPELYI